VTEAQLRPQAESDLVDRTRYYRPEGGDDVGRRFFDAASQRFAVSSECPALDHRESANSAIRPGYMFGGSKASFGAGSTS